MHIRLKTLSAGAALFLATPAMAATTVSFSPGGAPLLPGETIFANFNSNASTGGVTLSPTVIIQSANNGNGAPPATGDLGDPYLSILGGGQATFNFSPLSFIGLDYGSADNYNSFTLTLLSGATQVFTGSQVIAASANGNQSSPITNGRLTFSNSLDPFVSLRLSSSQNSLEIDNISSIAAVPEPGTWAMMLLGFGVLGFSMRRRHRATALLTQAA